MATFEITLLQFKEKLDLAGYAERTIKDYTEGMSLFFRYLEAEEDIYTINEVTKEHLTAYHTYLRYTPFRQGKYLALRTVITRLGVLKTFFTIMSRENLINEDLSHEIIIPPKKKNLPKYVPTEKEIITLLESIPPDTPVMIRDRAMIELLYATGLRSAELRSAEVDCLNIEDQTIFVTGKGSKDRVVPIGGWVLPFLREYLQTVRETLCKEPSPLLFVSKNGKKITEGNLCDLINKYVKRTKLDCKITPHSFRHACATHILKGGADIRHVQELLGHSDLSSTQIYTKVDITFLKEAHRKYHPRDRDADE